MPSTKAFLKLKRALTRQYLGEEVPFIYQKRYGKMYNKKDVESFAIAIAKKRRIPIDE